MTATTKQRAKIERTEHPHVVKSAGTLGGKARIDDQRISVLQLFQMFEWGMSVDEIIASHPTLTPAQVHDALSYAYDHPGEIAADAERQTLRSVLKRADMVYVEGRLIPRASFKESDVPPGAKAYTWETLPSGIGE
jgi:uncharacterized protein (DUF433 family)